ncbi:transcription factor zf-C2H2 type [Schizosaccharomyces octosporus yFS286]|uniref:Transcription factor zf-C2H2 type n=1 Tax=Schizosaccharomyces octosporus (strain yFS286) TaxID=483514 RepID=S9Q225_SCHOY|nr:transcription factor zf-C2H2 type [Schizosaccharomyces octosporus yFS286]EPX73758.1 transcription factor zf-C2H2 type [Schizosaccharomyces octosporus yFS286]
MSSETSAAEHTNGAQGSTSTTLTNPSSNVNTANNQQSSSVPPPCPYPHVGPSFVRPNTQSNPDEAQRRSQVNHYKNNLENVVSTMPGSSVPLPKGSLDPSANNSLCCCTTVHGHPHIPPTLINPSSSQYRLPPISTILGGSMTDPAIMAAAAASSPHCHPPNSTSPDIPLPPGFLSPYNPFSYAYFLAKANEAAAVAAAHQHRPTSSTDQHPQPSQHPPHVDPVTQSAVPPTTNPCSAVPSHHTNNSFLTFPFQPPYLPFVCPGCAQNQQNRLNPHPNNDGFVRCPAPSEHESFVSRNETETQESTNGSRTNEADHQSSENTSNRTVDMSHFGLTPEVHSLSRNGLVPENTSTASHSGYSNSNGFHDAILSELSAAATLAQNGSNISGASDGKSQSNKDPSAIEKRVHIARRHSNTRKSNQQSAAISSSTVRYRCTECLQGFSRPSSLKIHTYSHTGERPFVCDYVGCGKAFNVRSNMRRHQRIHGA